MKTDGSYETVTHLECLSFLGIMVTLEEYVHIFHITH